MMLCTEYVLRVEVRDRANEGNDWGMWKNEDKLSGGAQRPAGKVTTVTDG